MPGGSKPGGGLNVTPYKMKNSALHKKTKMLKGTTVFGTEVSEIKKNLHPRTVLNEANSIRKKLYTKVGKGLRNLDKYTGAKKLFTKTKT